MASAKQVRHVCQVLTTQSWSLCAFSEEMSSDPKSRAVIQEELLIGFHQQITCGYMLGAVDVLQTFQAPLNKMLGLPVFNR